MKKNSILTKLVLLTILIAALFLRTYKLDTVPPSISWDEAAVGYNSYTIANWGHDEYGYFFPITFKSFGDDKHPVHIYITALFVKLFGLSDFTIRLPVALFGSFNVLLIYFLAKTFFKKETVGLISAFIMAISPYSLQFSRFNHEANFSLFFFMSGLLLFLKGIERNNFLIYLSFIPFGLSSITYHSALAIVPSMIILLSVLYWKRIFNNVPIFLSSIIVILVFVFLYIIFPPLLGLSRLEQTSVSEEMIKDSVLYKSTGSMVLGRGDVFLRRYMSHYTPQYLFISGDKIARHSIQSVGEFYKMDALFLILGLTGVLLLRSKKSIVLLAWAVLAPIPASVSGGASEIPHAARSLFVMGSWHLILGYGYYLFINFFRMRWLKLLVLLALFLAVGYEFKNYLVDYYGDYSKREAIEWQYGMKQMVDYVKDHDEYSQVYMTEERSQPYIFFLYNLKYPLPEYLDTVIYNKGRHKSSNTVLSFDKYHFGDWEPRESSLNPGVLYILTPSEYSGLRSRELFSVKKKVTYPNGNDAYFLVSYP